MRPFDHTIPLDDARRRLEEAVRPIDRMETEALGRLAGRVLAEDLIAATDVPPFARAMMDGYAVQAADTAGAEPASPRTLRPIGRVFTGEVFDGTVAAGQCVEIATGAPLPAGATAVVMVEDATARADGRIDVRGAVVDGQHVGQAGADITAGTRVLRAGDQLLPARLGVVAALGLTTARVFAKPRVALISTGNEIVPAGRPLMAGQIHDVNRHTLAAVIDAHGGQPEMFDVVADTLDALQAGLTGALACDLVVFSGGSSVGDRDLVLDVLRDRGRVVFHGIATRPGKPTAFGDIEGVPVFGLPGNPTSCLTNAYVLLVPFLRRLARLPAFHPRMVQASLSRRVTSSLGRHQFYTVRLADGRAEPAFKASGDITSMAHADGYIEIAADVAAIEAGTAVDVTLF